MRLGCVKIIRRLVAFVLVYCACISFNEFVVRPEPELTEYS
jgi:hypothetical protein